MKTFLSELNPIAGECVRDVPTLQSDPSTDETGRIINTASIQSFDPSPILIAYASTKATIVSFTRQGTGLIRAGESEERRSLPHVDRCFAGIQSLCVAGNANVLSGYVERVAWRQLRIGKNRRELLGEDGLSKKEKGKGT